MTCSSPAVASFLGVIAALYSLVGHGGASGYLAVLHWAGCPPMESRAQALFLNLIVAAVAFLNFRAAGHFERRLLWPFAAASVPAAYLGATVKVSPRSYGLLLAAALAFAAWRLGAPAPEQSPEAPSRPPPWPAALGLGGLIGALSGIVGVGGGIFLSPLMILAGWADARRTAAVSAAFIWVNSAAGLLGHWRGHGLAGLEAAPVLAAAVGSLVGSFLGARKLSLRALRLGLAAVLLAAAGKSFFRAVEL